MTKHAIERARERYGIRLTDRDLAAIAEDILAHRAEWLRDQYGGRSIWRVHIARLNFDVPVVFHRETRAIVTVLPPRLDQCAPTAREIRDARFAQQRRQRSRSR